MASSYEKGRQQQQAELDFIDHTASFRRRLAQAHAANRPRQLYAYVEGELVNLETEAKVVACLALIALQAELGFGIV